MNELEEKLDELQRLMSALPADRQFEAGALVGQISNILLPPKPKLYAARSGAWQRVSNEYREDHPTCEGCGTTECIEVHHVEPFHLAPERELDNRNFIGLCMRPWYVCHYGLGHLFSWHSWNPNVRRDAKRRLKRIQNRPTKRRGMGLSPRRLWDRITELVNDL